MEVRMNRFRRFGWLGAVFAALLLVGVGVVAYNAGFSEGIAAQAPAAGAAVAPYGYRWHGGGWWFGPLFFVFFWLVVARAFFWGRPWWHYRYMGSPYDGPAGAFDEWHRRAHERMKEASAADDPGRRG
jgi:hypothetical protein